MKYKIENLEKKKRVEELFEEYKQVFKIRFFLIWGIDEYIGIKTYQYIEFYDEDLYFTLSFFDNFEPWDVNNFKIEENNKKFIDVEENIDFYINFFKEVDGKINKLWEEGEKNKEENFSFHGDIKMIKKLLNKNI